jgi:hypothetical protein
VATNTIDKLIAAARLKSFILPASFGLNDNAHLYDAVGRPGFRGKFVTMFVTDVAYGTKRGSFAVALA